jgi:phosphopantothenoylcysteine decarboxylase/phosphopantothenate--cysteine ligase
MTSSTPSPAAPRVVLGVAGGIAAYKSIEVLRRLRDAGCYVCPVLTAEATQFVGALTFSALASEPARTSLFDDPASPIPHTRLGQLADVVVVAPATAHVIGRLAAGLADDLLTATVLATRAPVVLCPAMHTEMWEQPVLQENLAALRARGVRVLGPASGELAGGDVGTGRMVEPDEIVSAALAIAAEGSRGPLAGRAVLVTAGGTREPIDPVRVITNRSSGHQGFAVAEVAARLGAHVTLVSAARRDLALDVTGRVQVVSVDSAEQMAEAVLERAASCDVVVMAAAVADFAPVPATTKIKKDAGPPRIELVATRDILAELVARRRAGQLIVGFAAETDDVRRRAIDKLRKKGCDLLVVNDVASPHAGFDHATNEVWIIDRDERETHVSLRSKEAVAEAILANVAATLSRGAP